MGKLDVVIQVIGMLPVGEDLNLRLSMKIGSAEAT